MRELGEKVERRGTGRFPLREGVRYRTLNFKGDPVSGSGNTLNIGSRGILFTTEDLLPVGRSVELSVDWPAQLNGNCPLKFVAVGRVIRSAPGQAAVRIERYEFKTRGKNATATPAASASLP
ncbi:MAG: hypothetical protein ABSE42_16430 [Bryobacteraceae bacterium]|jgi:hypothetical protein